MEISETLENIGMEPKEIKIYLYLLKNGPCSKQKISDDNAIVRQTVYEIVNKMLTKGYVSSSMTEKRKVYTATPPEFLLERLKEKEEQFTQIIPILKQLQQKGSSDLIVETFIGVKGFKNLLSITLRSKTELLWLASEEINKKLFEEYYHKNYVLKRVSAKIPLKLLTFSTHNKKMWHSNKKEIREVRMLNLVDNLKSASFVTFEDKVIIFSFKKDSLFGILIKNEIIHDMFKKIFLDYWERSKPF